MTRLDRRTFLATTAGAAVLTARPALAQAGGEDARLRAQLDAMFETLVDDSPRFATSLGLDKGKRAALKSQLDDNSAAAKARRLERTRGWLKTLKTVDRAKLSPASKVDLDVVLYQQETAVRNGDKYSFGDVGGNFSPYVISQRGGAYANVPDFLDSQHRVANADDAEAYLSRLRAFAGAMDNDLARQKSDVAMGVIPPDFVCDLAIGQMKALRDQPVEKIILVTSIAKKAKDANVPGDWAGQAAKIVLFPALDRQIAAMQAVRAKAKPDTGAWSLPNGDAYYADAVKASTTTNYTPQEGPPDGPRPGGRHLRPARRDPEGPGPEPGRDRPAADEAQRGSQAGLSGHRRRPRPDAGRPQQRRGLALHGAAHGVPDPAQGEGRGAPGPCVHPGRGRQRLLPVRGPRRLAAGGLLHQPERDQRLAALQSEDPGGPRDVPGHHLQIALAQESGDIPMLRRAGFGFSAFSEGWALYAEQLADEIGAYQGDPLGQAGYLQSLLFRAARLVTDTGIHYKRWGRAKATQYMVDTIGNTPSRAQREVERYFSSPGQANSYKVGHTVWAKVREDAKAKLGPKFDLKAYHDAVLLSGAMPLTVLQRHVSEWVVTQA